MNYYNPYFYNIPMYNTPRVGLLGRIFGTNINFSSILNGSQKVLNVANQAIPLIEKAKPMARNAKTMFKLMSEFKKTDRNTNISNNTNTNNVSTSSNNPTFFA